MSRLVVVSNRVTPISGSRAATAGGLAVGILAALRETGGIWFGWSGEQSDAAAPMPKVSRTGNITYITIDLAPRAFESYYGGFANRTLWPLFHYRLDLSSFDRDWYVTYRQVNQLFAEREIDVWTDLLTSLGYVETSAGFDGEGFRYRVTIGPE